MARCEAVLFDVDGTLINSRSAILYAYRTAAERVLQAPLIFDGEELEQLIQLPTEEGFLRVASGDRAAAARIATEFSAAYRVAEPDIAWFPAAKTAIRALKELGCAVGIVTTKARDRVESHLTTAGLADLVDVTISGDDVARHKPDPLPIVVAIELLGLAPDRVLYVGDGPNDVVAAHAAGASAVGVEFGFHPQECRDSGPEYWLRSYDDLPGLVRRLRDR